MDQDMTPGDERGRACVSGRDAHRADAEGLRPLPTTVAWRQHGRMSGDGGGASASPEFSSTGVPFVANMIMPTPTVALVGTYPPTVCGLATFTSHLSAAIAAPESGWRTVVVRVVDRPEADAHREVVAQWIVGDSASLSRAVAAIESSDAVVLQHEYGLFGGPDGQDVLELIEAVQVPLVAVLHTVLSDPSRHRARHSRPGDGGSIVDRRPERGRTPSSDRGP